jgi:hypothetical protein
MAKKKEPEVSRRDMMFIAAEAQCDLRTVQRAYEGGELKTLTRGRIVEAAKKLKLTLPPGVSS